MMSSTVYDKVYALTGAPGSGKSTVAGIFCELGAVVIDTDEIARQAIAIPEIECRIKETFGNLIISKDGQNIDRRKLGTLVFSNAHNRKTLEAIIHPQIRALADAAINAAANSARRPIIYDCPLFFETGLDKLGFKGVIVVSSSREKCLERTIARDGITLEEAKNRLQSQMPLDKKVKCADFVIDNSETLSKLRDKTQEIFTEISKQ